MDPTPSTPRRPRWAWVMLPVVVVVLAAAGWGGWRAWHAYATERDRVAGEEQRRWEAFDQTLETLRRDQRATSERLQDAAATNRVLRDEMLGLGQRSALLEETVSKLADPSRHGAQALRLDEVELLLSQGQQRLAIAGDLDGARRAYALAAGALAGIDDPAYLNVRQTLVQERNALDALGAGPQAALGGELERLVGQLDALPAQAADAAGDARPWWQKLLSPLVQVRPLRGNVLVAQSQRIGARDSLQIEISLARAALERGDATAWKQALARVDGWLVRLWPDSAALRRLRAELTRLQHAPLRPATPELGSTLLQLRAMREGRNGP
ncbi:uroporphyrinogen-III C-methyltransferase [[Pseudomonas] boreopolis]|uniref:uroporphyrinogen-III C-methyltransferase n=1 Tax=Xanthomonas boreopolis TaxID=86183 RepID=UPI003DA1C044